jgi:peptidoglycan/xylan/chitin deacetylase (PgdA/CDA1 family)
MFTLASVSALTAAIVVSTAHLLGGRSHPPGLAASARSTSRRARATPKFRARPTAAALPLSGRPTTAAVPILMYHVIAPPLANAPYPGLYVPPAEFVAQMHALAAAGYHAVTLDRVRDAWRGLRRLPARPIVISFDNGYRSQYTEAFPILRRLGWRGEENLQLSGLPPTQGGLDARQVRALVAAGWELDTQGYSHADLIRLDSSQLHYEVAVARRTIERRYHVEADWFCYPSGHYDATVIAEVKAAGYVGATTVIPGWARPSDDPYRLPRLRVLGGTSPQTLLTLIADSRHAAPLPDSYPPAAEDTQPPARR